LIEVSSLSRDSKQSRCRPPHDQGGGGAQGYNGPVGSEGLYLLVKRNGRIR